MAEAEVLFEERGAAGIITLNRPQALNAFGIATVRAMRPKGGRAFDYACHHPRRGRAGLRGRR